MKTLHVQHEPKSEYDPYQNLAYEIILRAIADYRSLGQKLSLPLYPDEKRKVENEKGRLATIWQHLIKLIELHRITAKRAN